jgi:uroporphyrin-III C-methyltransferase / precorrin-2 dehydrogenase / sirohydrochlorin ferrochelatase
MNTPKVILAGSGPGDVDLITIKLVNAFAIANVIVVDRLVNSAIVTTYTKQNAKIIFVGKEGYNNLSFTQEQINNIIVDEALKGNVVLRLKGGDVAFFSNVLDELIALKANNIPFEIIPGITAASGASAYAAIPLTARGYSKGVRFITYNAEENFSEDEWENMSNTKDTLVVYMGIKNLKSMLINYKKYTRKEIVHIAIIEQASTIFQKTHLFTLEELNEKIDEQKFTTPALIIIGDVVQLHNKFDWFVAPNIKETVFPIIENTTYVS